VSRISGDSSAALSRSTRPREGESSREDILDAAAELFSQKGYSATSTRAIALAVGIKQASLYYHFVSKEAILAELLAGTVQPSIDVAHALGKLPGRAVSRLHALLTFDTQLLCAGKWNVGSLYLLPELRHPRFASFQADRDDLKKAYGRLVRAARKEGDLTFDNDRVATDLLFALGEGIILIRADRAPSSTLDDVVATLPDAGLRMLGLPAGRLGVVGRESARLLALVHA
jgi:AcrR family transcriptional regulator